MIPGMRHAHMYRIGPILTGIIILETFWLQWHSAYALNWHLGHLGQVTLYTKPLQLHPIWGGSHIFLKPTVAAASPIQPMVNPDLGLGWSASGGGHWMPDIPFGVLPFPGYIFWAFLRSTLGQGPCFVDPVNPCHLPESIILHRWRDRVAPRPWWTGRLYISINFSQWWHPLSCLCWSEGCEVRVHLVSFVIWVRNWWWFPKGWKNDPALGVGLMAQGLNWCGNW